MSSEGCPSCGNEDVFHELIDGNLICMNCGDLLKVDFIPISENPIVPRMNKDKVRSLKDSK